MKCCQKPTKRARLQSFSFVLKLFHFCLLRLTENKNVKINPKRRLLFKHVHLYLLYLTEKEDETKLIPKRLVSAVKLVHFCHFVQLRKDL